MRQSILTEKLIVIILTMLFIVNPNTTFGKNSKIMSLATYQQKLIPNDFKQTDAFISRFTSASTHTIAQSIISEMEDLAEESDFHFYKKSSSQMIVTA